MMTKNQLQSADLTRPTFFVVDSVVESENSQIGAFIPICFAACHNSDGQTVVSVVFRRHMHVEIHRSCVHTKTGRSVMFVCVERFL